MNRIFFQSKSSGLTIVEALIGIGFLSSMVAGLGIYAKNLKDNIRKTEIGQVADTIEIGIRGILQREDVLVNTLKKQGNTALRNCVLRSTSNCRHNKVYKVDFYMLGTKKPFTGSKVLYTDYLFMFEVLGLLLLVIPVGTVALSRIRGGTHAR